MPGTHQPNRSASNGGRRCLSLFLLAVFLPLLWPAEVWASLARPAALPGAALAAQHSTPKAPAPTTADARGNNAAPTVTVYLILVRPPLPFPNTGYAQILEVSQSIAAQCFITGDDILGQSSGGNTAWLLYDGHGSTRALAGADVNGQPTITARYSYDAYGMMLGGDPSLSRPAATDLLYSGEQWDAGLQQQYLRARYYQASAGVFASLDTFEGNNGEPQSLHKYAYCHGDGVNEVDPSGRFTLIEILVVVFVIALVGSIAIPKALRQRRKALALAKADTHRAQAHAVFNPYILASVAPALRDRATQDANTIIDAYVSEFYMQYEWYGEASDPNPDPNDDLHAGYLCFQWAAMVHRRLASYSYDVLKVNWVGHALSTGLLDHNYVRVAVTEPEAQTGPQWTNEIILDPWMDHTPRVYSGGVLPLHRWSFVHHHINSPREHLGKMWQQSGPASPSWIWNIQTVVADIIPRGAQ